MEKNYEMRPPYVHRNLYFYENVIQNPIEKGDKTFIYLLSNESNYTTKQKLYPYKEKLIKSTQCSAI